MKKSLSLLICSATAASLAAGSTAVSAHAATVNGSVSASGLSLGSGLPIVGGSSGGSGGLLGGLPIVGGLLCGGSSGGGL